MRSQDYRVILHLHVLQGSGGLKAISEVCICEKDRDMHVL
jgi:hypothetical protein